MTVFAWSLPAAAQYDGASGYDSGTTGYALEIEHDGYPRSDEGGHDGQIVEADGAPEYVVIEVEEGVSEEVDGETVIVVQEPEPAAATDEPPPPPRQAPLAQPAMRCAGGIWVDGYWSYADGQYLWVDGHCVVERVNYVFVHPRWDFYADVWWFVPGYYRPCGVWVGFGYYRPWHWFPPYHRPYYRGYRGVPVHRGVPGRATVARPVSRSTHRGVGPRTISRSPQRATTVRRQPPTRTSTVGRLPPTRTTSVTRRAPSRTSTVGRLPPTRTTAVTRTPPSRASTVSRVPPSPASTITRVPPTRSPTVTRVPTTSRPTVTRAKPTRTPTLGRARPGPSRAPSVSGSSGIRSRYGGVSRPSSAPSRVTPVRRPSFAPSRAGSLSRPSPSRSGGFGRPSTSGFGRGRSIPTARGR